MNNLAKLYQLTGQLPKAEALFSKAFKFRKKVLGETHKETLISHGNLIGLYVEMKQFDKATDMARDQLRVNVKRSSTIAVNLKSIDTLVDAYKGHVDALKTSSKSNEAVKEAQSETTNNQLTKAASDLQVAKDQVATLSSELTVTKEALVKSEKELMLLKSAAPKDDLSATVAALNEKIEAMESVHNTEIKAYTDQGKQMKAQNAELSDEISALKAASPATPVPCQAEPVAVPVTGKKGYQAQEKLLQKITQCQEKRIQLEGELQTIKSSQ